MSNILITGGAGYIGGTVLANLIDSKKGGFAPGKITALVRTADQAQKLSKLGIRVLQVDLADGESVAAAILEHDIDLVIHCASAVDPSLALPLIEALGERINKTGKPSYFIHTSGTSAYADVTGWTHGAVKDSDPVLELEKSSKPYYARDTNVAVYDHATKHGVTICLVVPPFIYGKGSGEGSQESFQLPSMVRVAISRQRVTVPSYIGEHGWPAVHISDVADLYILIVKRIATGDAKDAAGYYFGVAHDVVWRETMDHLSRAMYDRGLVTDPETDFWPSDEAAAEAMSIPAMFMPLLWASKTKAIPERSLSLGWKPVWDNAKFLASLGDEVDAARNSAVKGNQSTLDHIISQK